MRKLPIMLPALIFAAAVVTPGTATAETAVLTADCSTTIYDEGTAAPPIQLAGTFQILGTAPAASGINEPLIIDDVQVTLTLDWQVLGPELESRGVTQLSGYLQAAWFDVTVDGVPNWPAPIHDNLSIATFPVAQLGTGISTAANDVDLSRWLPATPGTMHLTNYDKVYFSLRKLDNPQVALSIQCAPTPNQNTTFGEVTIHA